MQGAENLLDYYRRRPPGWIVIEDTPEGVSIHDPDISLMQALGSRWITFAMAIVSLALWWGTSIMAFPQGFLELASGILVFFVLLLVFCIWQRWRTPSLVRIGKGRVYLWRRRGAKLSEEQWSVADIAEIETSFGSSTFHSFYAFRFHLRDGTRPTFLHCMSSKEGYWLLNFLKMMIANEQGALVVQEGLAPALEVSLPPPPLPAMNARIAKLEEQVIGMPQPAQPQPQIGSLENQRRA